MIARPPPGRRRTRRLHIHLLYDHLRLAVGAARFGGGAEHVLEVVRAVLFVLGERC